MKQKEERDLNIDFLRGVVMFILVIIHTEIFSFYNFLVWERIGIVSGGEGFVIFSGLITGMVYKNKIIENGFKDTMIKLLKRSFQLYRVNLFIIFSIFIITITGLFDTSSVTTFVDYGSKQVYNLYIDPNASYWEIFKPAFLLQIGPHQTQILGLYTILMALSPFVLYLLSKKYMSFLIFIISWTLYAFNQKYNIRLTNCQFEYAFPLLTWQVLFFNGMIFGFYKNDLKNKLSNLNKKIIFYICLVLFIGFFIFAQNTPNNLIPDFTKLHFIQPQVYSEIYSKYFLKNSLGILRLVNYFSFLIVIYAFLSKYKKDVYKYLGWFFIPIGQATLYVFIFHVYLVMMVANFVTLGFDNYNLYLNTLVHSLVLFLLWLMVKTKFLFRFVPR